MGRARPDTQKGTRPSLPIAPVGGARSEQGKNQRIESAYLSTVPWWYAPLRTIGRTTYGPTRAIHALSLLLARATALVHFWGVCGKVRAGSLSPKWSRPAQACPSLLASSGDCPELDIVFGRCQGSSGRRPRFSWRIPSRQYGRVLGRFSSGPSISILLGSARARLPCPGQGAPRVSGDCRSCRGMGEWTASLRAHSRRFGRGGADLRSLPARATHLRTDSHPQ